MFQVLLEHGGLAPPMVLLALCRRRIPSAAATAARRRWRRLLRRRGDVFDVVAVETVSFGKGGGSLLLTAPLVALLSPLLTTLLVVPGVVLRLVRGQGRCRCLCRPRPFEEGSHWLGGRPCNEGGVCCRRRSEHRHRRRHRLLHPGVVRRFVRDVSRCSSSVFGPPFVLRGKVCRVGRSRPLRVTPKGATVPPASTIVLPPGVVVVRRRTILCRRYRRRRCLRERSKSAVFAAAFFLLKNP